MKNYLFFLKIWLFGYATFILFSDFFNRIVFTKIEVFKESENETIFKALLRKTIAYYFYKKSIFKRRWRYLIWLKNKALIGLRRRVANLLFHHLRKHNLVDSAVKIYSDRLDGNRLSLEEFYFLANWAIEQKDELLLEKCILGILSNNLIAVENSRDFAVQLFLKGRYKQAKLVWTAIEKYRLNLIQEMGLDKLKLKVLPAHWFIAIGHIAHLDSYFKNEFMCQRNGYSYYLDVPIGLKIPNPYFLNLWNQLLNSDVALRKVSRLTNEEIVLLQDDFWSSLIDTSSSALMFNEFGSEVQKKWFEQSGKSIISIPYKDTQVGYEILSEWGLPENAWFVCLHVREPGFHMHWHKTNPGTRNANIDSYYEAISFITSMGGYVIRMGDKSMKEMPLMDGVIDYAHKESKSDFMDIFLCAECKFFIGTNSGLGLVPPVFGKICLLTNWSPVAIPQWYPKDIFIPKLIRRRSDGSNLSFKEMFSTMAGWSQFTKYFDDEDLDVIDNTSEEILNGVQDIFSILDGIDTPSENILVNKFQKVSYEYIGYSGSMIATSFIKKYESLLDE